MNNDTRDQRSALAAVSELVKAGMPVFTCRLKANGDPVPPRGWERTKADPAAVGRWSRGRALCGVTGTVYDVLDVDPRNGGKESWDRLAEDLGDEGPEVYWTVFTPSGGTHFYIAPLGIGSRPGFLPGIDLKGGLPDGESRGFVFMPPTERPSQVDGVMHRYKFGDKPRIPDGDEGCQKLREAIARYEAERNKQAGNENGNGADWRELRNAVLNAPRGLQRHYLLRYCFMLQRKISDWDLVIDHLVNLKVTNFNTRKPWTEKDFRNLLKKDIDPEPTISEQGDLNALAKGPDFERARRQPQGAVTLAPLPVFPADAIPGPLRDLIAGSPALPAPTIGGFGLAVLAALCGYASVGMPDGAHENAILWNAVISGSGTAKSPSLRRAIAPLQTAGNDLLIDPTITVEALARKLAGMGEPTGLIASDELKGFLEGIGQYRRGSGSDRAKFMELHNSGYQWNYTRVANARKGVGIDEVIDSPVISVCGGLTPSGLRLLGDEEDGFRARWLPFATDSAAVGFEKSPVPPEWKTAVLEMYEVLPKRRKWVMGRAALEIWEDADRRWLARRQARDEPQAVLLALNKASMHAARLALALAESVTRNGRGGRVPAECMAGAVEIMGYCLDGWAYLGSSELSGITAADRIMEERVYKLSFLIEGIPGKRTEARRIRQNQWCGVKSSIDLDRLLGAYAKRFPGLVTEERTGGRGPKTKMVSAPARGNS